MYINISDFIRDSSQLIFKDSGSCDLEGLDKSTSFDGEADFEVLISKVNDDELVLNLDIDYEFKKPCDRCLKEVTNYDSIEYSGNLVNNIPFEDDPYFDEEADYILMENEEIAICKLVKELIILSIPMKNLCDEDCKGLCPKCGQDLNKGQCDCDTDDVDIRFSVLKDFKIDEEV